MLQNDFWEHVISDTKELAGLLLRKVKSRQSHEANLTLVTDLVHNPNWSYSQSSLVSRADPWNTYGAHDDQHDDTPERYAMLSLWEIQLKLGEIPDLISNNLLTPCLQENHVGCTLSIPQTHSPPAWRLKASDDGDEILQNLKDKRLEGGDEKFVAYGGQDSSSSSEPVGPSSIIYFSESKRVGTTTEEGEGQEHEDEDETEEDKEDEEDEQKQDAQERIKPECHPVYGMLLCDQGEEADEYRHDRKDSGVFMHSLEDEFEAFWVHGPLSLACALPHPSC